MQNHLPHYICRFGLWLQQLQQQKSFDITSFNVNYTAFFIKFKVYDKIEIENTWYTHTHTHTQHRITVTKKYRNNRCLLLQSCMIFLVSPIPVLVFWARDKIPCLSPTTHYRILSGDGNFSVSD